MKARIFILQLLLLITFQNYAQEILVVVTDKKREPIINATVKVTQGGVLKGGGITDYDGKYSVKPLDPGLYEVTVSYTGMQPKTITGVVVTAGDRTEVNVMLDSFSEGRNLKEVTIRYTKPLIDKYKSNNINSLAVKSMPNRGNTDLVELTPGVFQNKRGTIAEKPESEAPGNVYIIDGVQVQGAIGVNMAQGATSQIQLNYESKNKEEYKRLQENDFKSVKNNPLSTMSVDVDRASYSNIRRFIENNEMPPADAVRIEEMINYFNYNYPKPKAKDPIAIETELTKCPWNNSHYLLRIGMQARQPDYENLPASNLVFLIDVSGSMNEPDKLPLVKESMRLLVKQLRKKDRVSIVVYAGNSGMVLAPTSGDRKKEIMAAIDKLEAGGSTAGGEGIILAYKTATSNFISGGNNRVILATDGDFNVGITSQDDLEKLITEKRKSGVFLTCLGFGEGNYKDETMELLADKGNGNYSYVDNIREAQKLLVKEFGGTMFTIAKDVKSQIEFNPNKVRSYRLVGYENRLLADRDFKDDTKDAGDMGAGHSVTVLYELVPNLFDNSELKYTQQQKVIDQFEGEMATVKFRYKEPDASESKLMTQVIANECKDFAAASENTRFATAVAMYGMLLKSSGYSNATTYQDVISLAESSKGIDADGYRAEMVKMATWSKIAHETGKDNKPN